MPTSTHVPGEGGWKAMQDETVVINPGEQKGAPRKPTLDALRESYVEISKLDKESPVLLKIKEQIKAAVAKAAEEAGPVDSPLATAKRAGLATLDAATEFLPTGPVDFVAPGAGTLKTAGKPLVKSVGEGLKRVAAKLKNPVAEKALLSKTLTEGEQKILKSQEASNLGGSWGKESAMKKAANDAAWKARQQESEALSNMRNTAATVSEKPHVNTAVASPRVGTKLTVKPEADHVMAGQLKEWGQNTVDEVLSHEKPHGVINKPSESSFAEELRKGKEASEKAAAARDPMKVVPEDRLWGDEEIDELFKDKLPQSSK